MRCMSKRPSDWAMLAAFIAAAMPAPLARSNQPQVDPRRPNVILILADDLGYGDPGSFNPESKIPTPRIDGLAAAGMRFTDAHSPSSVCTPTRYGLLTGRYAWRTRLTSGVLDGYSPALLEPDRTTLATLARAQGYRTACIGKWHLGLGSAERADYARTLSPGPRTAGFEKSFVLPASLDMPPYVFVEDERATVFPSEHIEGSKMRRHGGEGFWRAGAIAPGFRHVDTLPMLAARAVGFLEQQSSGTPFLLYFPLTAPHTPWMPTEEFRSQTAVDFYGDFVAQVDATLGVILDVLEKKQLASNTLVIFTSDNGAHWLPEDITKWKHRANAEWRGQKADLWEGGHRVPLVVRWPGQVAPGSRSDATVCLTDLLATLAELWGENLPDDAGEDSFSILPLLTGDAASGPRRSSIVHHSADGTFAIRRGPWKLAMKLGSHGFSEPRNVEPLPDGPQGQLYHLMDDPGETRNRWLETPEVVAELTALLQRIQREGRSRPID